jgi:hypothetical protein
LIKELAGEDNQAVIYEDNLGAIYIWQRIIKCQHAPNTLISGTIG